MLPLRAENPEKEKTLVSWKEIASFLDRAERTVRRWERERGLPVHRVPGGERGGVYAYPSELEEWLKGKKGELDEDEPAPGGNDHEDESATGRKASSPETASAHSVAVRRRTPMFARLIAWLIPLALTAALIFYLSGIHTNSGAKVLGDRSPSNIRVQELQSDAIAVLPFSNVGANPGSDYLTDGITDSLIGSLAHVPELKVRSRDSVFRIKGKDVDVQQAGSDLGAVMVVSGRVSVRTKDIEISAELTDVRNNTEIWGKQYAGKMSNLVQLQGQIAGDIAKQLRSNLSAADKQRVTQQGTQSAEAYNLYLKGRYAWYQRSPANLNAALSYFDQAIVKDPEYALAYSGLADVYAVMPNFGGNPAEDFPKSNAAARRALELDPTLAHPHAILGANLTEYNWDFTQGEAEFKKAIALDPNDATAHQWYAEKIGQLGRHREALAEINRAHELDPLSPVITRVMAGTLADAGQYDRAIEICNHLVKESPTLSIGHDCLYEAYWAKHLYSQSVQEWILKSRMNGTPDEIKLADALERGYQSAGWNGAVRGAAAAMEARRKSGYASAFDIARFCAEAGDKERAFYWLDTALREHDRLLLGLEVLPGFEKIRPDPRFAELARKVGLQELP